MAMTRLHSGEEWAAMLDELGVRMGLPTRTAVVGKAVELLALSQGLEPVERLPADKFHPWLRPGRGGPLSGQGSD